MNKTEYLITQGDKLQRELEGTMPELAFMLADINYEFEDGEMAYDPQVLFEVDRTIDKWADDYLIPVLVGLSSVISTLNSMIADEYAKYGSTAGVETGVMRVVGINIEQGSYLDAVTELGSVKADIKRFLTTAMSSGYTKKQVNAGIKELLSQGGVLDRYFKTYLYDLVSQYERMLAQAVAKKLNLNHFEYSGNIIQDTRSFCIERAGRVYSVKEAKKWNDLSWRGKIEGVDVMIALGGYNCRHWVSYIDESDYGKRLAEGNKGAEDE